jgi:hypothetical protein
LLVFGPRRFLAIKLDGKREIRSTGDPDAVVYMEVIVNTIP